ncbi:SMI1/KNR4 family protein [Hathewaya histolytica]|uniref:SMI1 / KNR4 family n=2 Tax=Hathewaya histolytica TaxID=1498 RepID=A0A4U9R2Q1_HATHI|nr:SMI1 / KNR4 family [Hathewaya histolytica]
MVGYKDYEKAVNLIEDNEELKDDIGGCSYKLIEMAEKRLNMKFPKSYTDFLLKFGALSFGSEEIYGIVREDFDNSRVPDAIWYTLVERRDAQIPYWLLSIYDTGSEELICLNFNNINKEGEPTVVSFVPGIDREYQIYEEISKDFGEFLLSRIKMELDI